MKTPIRQIFIKRSKIIYRLKDLVLCGLHL